MKDSTLMSPPTFTIKMVRDIMLGIVSKDRTKEKGGSRLASPFS
jgi:hypothetical protein